MGGVAGDERVKRYERRGDVVVVVGEGSNGILNRERERSELIMSGVVGLDLKQLCLIGSKAYERGLQSSGRGDESVLSGESGSGSGVRIGDVNGDETRQLSELLTVLCKSTSEIKTGICPLTHDRNSKTWTANAKVTVHGKQS